MNWSQVKTVPLRAFRFERPVPLRNRTHLGDGDPDGLLPEPRATGRTAAQDGIHAGRWISIVSINVRLTVAICSDESSGYIGRLITLAAVRSVTGRAPSAMFRSLYAGCLWR